MQKNWQGRQDSNGQPTESKPAAPPLRDSPITWSGWVDSNHRPLASKARTLTRLRYIQKNCPFKNWCPRGESNSQNPASKASMSASFITGALPQLMLRPQTHFGCVLTRPAPWRGQVSLHKGANPCTSSPGACALIERAVVQRHTRSEAAVWRCPQQRATTGPDTERIQAGGPSRARSPRNQQIKTKTKTKRPGAKWRPGLKSARGKVYTTLLRPGRGVLG